MNRLCFPKGILAIASLSVMLSACGGKNAASDDAKADVKPVVPVKAILIAEGNIEDVLTTTGVTAATRKEKIYAPIAGRLEMLTAIEGTQVKKGDVLAVIESKEAQAAKEGARLMLTQATTPAQKQAAEQALAEAESTSNGISVRAGFDGIVEGRVANSGEFVSENQELLTLTDPTSITFVADVPLRELPRLHVGVHATLELPGLVGEHFDLTMVGSKPKADLQSQTAQVVLRFDHPTSVPDLKTDVQGIASFHLGGIRRALLVPSIAVLRDDETDSSSIETFGADSLAHSVMIRRGTVSGDHVEISSPQLRSGMPVIIEGNYALADSTRITLVH